MLNHHFSKASQPFLRDFTLIEAHCLLRIKRTVSLRDSSRGLAKLRLLYLQRKFPSDNARRSGIHPSWYGWGTPWNTAHGPLTGRHYQKNVLRCSGNDIWFVFINIIALKKPVVYAQVKRYCSTACLRVQRAKKDFSISQCLNNRQSCGSFLSFKRCLVCADVMVSKWFFQLLKSFFFFFFFKWKQTSIIFFFFFLLTLLNIDVVQFQNTWSDVVFIFKALECICHSACCTPKLWKTIASILVHCINSPLFWPSASRPLLRLLVLTAFADAPPPQSGEILAKLLLQED